MTGLPENYSGVMNLTAQAVASLIQDGVVGTISQISESATAQVVVSGLADKPFLDSSVTDIMLNEGGEFYFSEYGPTVTFSSSATDGNVQDLIKSGTGTAQLKISQGSTGVKEVAEVVFNDLSAGKTIGFGGLLFTAGANGATATQIADAFASRADGFSANTTTVPGGQLSGTLAGWGTGADSVGLVSLSQTESDSNESLFVRFSLDTAISNYVVKNYASNSSGEVLISSNGRYEVLYADLPKIKIDFKPFFCNAY